MGRQVRFFIFPAEEPQFLDFVFQKPGVKLLKIYSETPEFLLERASLVEPQRQEMVYICYPGYTWDEASVEKFYCMHYDEESEPYLDESRPFFRINHPFSAPLIEYVRPFFRQEDEALIKSRIWASMFYYEGETLMRKDAGFIAWYEQIARWIRKNLKREPQLDYVSPRAWQWHQDGGAFH